MTESEFGSRLAQVLGLRSSVDAELYNRLAKTADFVKVRHAAQEYADEYVLLADLVEAQRLLQGCGRGSTLAQLETAEDFARGTLADCGVTR